MTAATINKGGRPRVAPAPNAYDKALGERVRLQMELCRMGPTQMADRIGTHKSQVYRYLAGDTPIAPEVLARMAGALGCQVQDFTKDLRR